MSPILNAQSLVERFYDLTAVDDVRLTVNEGETFGLLGPNGAGKTTTISMIAGILDPDEGSVTVAGETITTGSTRGRGAIGLVPQDLAIYPDLTGEENLSFFGRLYGMGGDLLSERIEEVLDVVGLSDRKDDPTKEYSG
ncbi:MAG TPA: ABC transporter ATP-binding protein, partial [Acidimicrobiia bacterium]|nr:ABC transporter ATP-binding protein [Acidimicrobiia bacterium]